MESRFSQALFYDVITTLPATRGPGGQSGMTHMLIGAGIVALVAGVLSYQSRYKEITWREFSRLYLSKHVVSFAAFLPFHVYDLCAILGRKA